MRFWKAISVASLLMVGSVLAGQSAHADTIVFHDLTDTVTVDGSGRLGPVAPNTVECNALEVCRVTLNAPTGYVFSSSTLPTGLYRIREPGGVTVSDRFFITPSTFVTGSTSVQFTFDSDVLEPGVVPCSSVTGICNVVENGLLQIIPGTITWSPNGIAVPSSAPNIVDNVGFTSDVEPEPASLILFGSGLVIAGGFLRRRRRLAVTPSV